MLYCISPTMKRDAYLPLYICCCLAFSAGVPMATLEVTVRWGSQEALQQEQVQNRLTSWENQILLAAHYLLMIWNHIAPATVRLQLSRLWPWVLWPERNDDSSCFYHLWKITPDNNKKPNPNTSAIIYSINDCVDPLKTDEQGNTCCYTFSIISLSV